MTGTTIQSITSEIKSLLADLSTRTRKLKEDRIKAGQLLIQLRDKFSVKNSEGTVLRGPKGGSFCAHLLANGLNLGQCYGFIALAEGKNPNSTVRVQFWQTFNKKMKKASDKQKLALLKKAVAHIVKLYAVKATVTVQES